MEELSELQTPFPIPQIHLPQHLLTEILVRLPIKSLIRFKSVSKEWKSIISSPYFARFHLHFQRSSPNYSPKLLFLIVDAYSRHRSISPDDYSFWVFDYAAYDKGGNHLYEIDPFPIRGADVWGCSDGLVLLAAVSFHIWNPATRESREIVPPTFKNHRKWGMVAGFGYVSSIEDYKIVCFSVRSEYPPDDIENHNYEAQAFTLCLNAATWKKVGCYVPDFRWGCDSRAGVLVNEKTYWLLRNPNRFDHKLCIVGFDLASEEFLELEPAAWMNGGDKGQFLSVIDGCLCFCSFDYSGRVDISMLKQGGSTSWVKFYCFYNVDDRPFDCLNVSGVWSGKYLICSSTESSVLVDMNQDPPVTKVLTTTRRHFGFPDHVEYYYIESLASPFGVVDGNTKADGVVDGDTIDDGVVDLVESSVSSKKKVGKIKLWVVVVHAIILVISIAFAMRQVN